MKTVTIIALAQLSLAAILTLARLLRRGSLADRIVALDTLLIIVVCGVAVGAVWTDSTIFLDVLVVAALLGFTGTALVARFIQRRSA